MEKNGLSAGAAVQLSFQGCQGQGQGQMSEKALVHDARHFDAASGPGR